MLSRVLFQSLEAASVGARDDDEIFACAIDKWLIVL
jgi:hypothetical protein